MEKRICKYCGKEYEVDLSLGIWQKNGTQKLGTPIGVSPKNFCSYECGKAYRVVQINKTWKDKSTEEKQALNARKNYIMKVKCAVCGKEFETSSMNLGKIHICSELCYKIRKYKLPESGIRICETCGKEYYYEQGQGNWDSDNNLVWAKGGKNGKDKKYTVFSHKYCCYECGIKHKEQKRNETNLAKYGFTSPFQDSDKREKIFNKLKDENRLFTSKEEKNLRKYINSLGFKTDKLISGNGLHNERIEIDIIIPELKIGFEYNGTYYHAINGKKKDRNTSETHLNKWNSCKTLGYTIYNIWEDQWLNNKDYILHLIKLKLFANTVTAENPQFKILQKDNTYIVTAKIENKLIEQLTLNVDTHELTHELFISNACKSYFTKMFNLLINKISFNINEIFLNIDLDLFNPLEYEKSGFKKDTISSNKFYVASHAKERSKTNTALKWICYGVGVQKLVWRKA